MEIRNRNKPGRKEILDKKARRNSLSTIYIDDCELILKGTINHIPLLRARLFFDLVLNIIFSKLNAK